MNTCGGCQREILWAVVEDSGRRMPLDPNPLPGGNVEASGRTDAATGAPLVKVLGKDEPGRPGADRYRSHFASCPKAGDYRRSR